MDRKEFLTAAKPSRKKQVPFSEYKGARVLSGIQPYAGAWTSNEILHLLRRTMFGAKKADVDFFAGMTMSQAVDYMLNVPTTPPTPPVKTYNNSVTAGDPDAAIPLGSTWVNINTTDGGIEFQRRLNYKNWWLGLMINQERNIREKLVLFWHNHFATETQEIARAIWCYQNNVVIRQNVLGNFKVFTKAISLDTGMLRYLNGYLNAKAAPDENYARELLELFTVGKGIDNASAPFIEADVIAAAKVLTGWQLNGTNNTTLFNINRHDTTSKTFSSFFNNTVITGRAATTAGELELNDLLTMIFNTNEVALNICRKLYRFFVYYEIDAATEASVIVPLAQIFRSSNYELLPVMATLFKSEHFFDALNQGCVIKTPMDVIVGMCREFSVQFPVGTDYISNNFMWQFLQASANALQMDIGDPPNVAGWAVYYQRPQFHEIWINSDTLPKRNQFTDTMAAGGYTRSGKNIKIDPVLFASSMPDPANPNALISDAVKYLLTLPLSQASRDQVKTDILLTGQSTDAYWTTAWTTYKNNPANLANAAIVKTRLTSLFQYLMRLAEYQLS